MVGGVMVSPTPRSLQHNMDSCDNDSEARDRKYPRKSRGPNAGGGLKTTGGGGQAQHFLASAGCSVPGCLTACHCDPRQLAFPLRASDSSGGLTRGRGLCPDHMGV